MWSCRIKMCYFMCFHQVKVCLLSMIDESYEREGSSFFFKRDISNFLLHVCPFLCIIHMVCCWSNAWNSCFNSRGFLHVFCRCAKWKSVEILSWGFLQVYHQCILKICVNNALTRFEKKWVFLKLCSYK